ncbi:EAL domain-containing protein [Rhodovastum atsumiense]|uniref:EAL domain-containing protein n=1 Tax=Rhodovastum atsumiense TaxID=504468 RepID=A0A5M6J1B6_9PROT|nr:sensor domain-containing phosphodiesterase [Rhodovastum atsumiense]KAA5613435.1 EAL domain-containing protein [Rhodovastum atsumiense]CAH2603167.1 EAL domain-containing protein [Rhodovastum atsumiense]
MQDAKEEARLDALRQLDLLDTPPSEAFDRITRMAARLFDLPIAAVSLTDLDRQWFKSRVGVSHTQIPRDRAPCAQVAESSGVLVIPDLLDDPWYRDSYLAGTGVRFYAAAPLITREGHCLGAMCVLGIEPRQASGAEMAALGDLAAMVMAQIELQHAFGRVDPLSGLPNRNQFIEDLEDLARDRPADEPRMVVLVDLAGPERLSATLRVMGSAHVDEAILRAARVLRAAMGAEKRIYHVGPTQFLFLAPPGADATRIAAGLDATLVVLGGDVGPGLMTDAVAGIAPFHLGKVIPRDVLRIAHGAAEDARLTGQRTGLYSQEQDKAHRRRFRLLQDFAQAVTRPGQLRLVYQPRIDLASGRCLGAEALLRWRHPELGEVSPGEFMPLVERTAMVHPATGWVLAAAMRQLRTWRDGGITLQISVNISTVNLVEGEFAATVLDGLVRHRLPAECLELEVTESAVMQDAGRALAALQALADGGIRLAIDDFGTGYSSLAYLQRLPASVVKIDQSFMRDLMGDARRRALVAAMISLGHDLGYHVVAEGVESVGVRDYLASVGCDEAQGYLFGRPMEVDDFVTWVRQAGGEAAPGPGQAASSVGM